MPILLTPRLPHPTALPAARLIRPAYLLYIGRGRQDGTDRDGPYLIQYIVPPAGYVFLRPGAAGRAGCAPYGYTFGPPRRFTLVKCRISMRQAPKNALLCTEITNQIDKRPWIRYYMMYGFVKGWRRRAGLRRLFCCFVRLLHTSAPFAALLKPGRGGRRRRDVLSTNTPTRKHHKKGGLPRLPRAFCVRGGRTAARARELDNLWRNTSSSASQWGF